MDRVEKWIIREYEGNFDGFKAAVNVFLTEIPDFPCLNGYRNGNNNLFDKETNTIPIWIKNLNSHFLSFNSNIISF